MRDGARPHATFDARRRGALAFTCAVHLLALSLWTQERHLPPVRRPRVVTILLQADPGQAARPPEHAEMRLLPAPAVSAPAAQPEPEHRVEDDDARRTTGRTAERTTERAPEHDARRDPLADTAPATAPPVPAPAGSAPNPIDTAQVASPATDVRALARTPDGVVIYRFRQGNRYRCRRAGGVGMPLAGMPGTGSITAGGAGAAGATDCPKGVVWNQDP